MLFPIKKKTHQKTSAGISYNKRWVPTLSNSPIYGCWGLPHESLSAPGGFWIPWAMQRSLSGLSKVCGRRGPHFCWVMRWQYAGRYRWKALPESHMAHQAGEKWVSLELMEGLPVLAGPPQLSALVLARNGVGHFLLTLLSSCSPGSLLNWSCSFSSSFSSQCTWTMWPYALICLGHVLAYSFGPRKRNGSALFTLNSDLFRHWVMWSP